MVAKLAIVTGSNKGIGFGIVTGLCKKFDGIIYLTSRNVERGEAAVKELKNLGYTCRFHQLDIDNQNSVNQFRDYIKKNYEGIDILVNNAAIAFKVNATAPFSQQAKETIQTNYFGTLRVCQALFPLLKPHARVVNISSSSGHLSRIPNSDLRAKLSDPNLTEDQLSSLMNSFVKSAEANCNVEDGWGNSAYVVSKVGVSALTVIQQREFDADSRLGIIVNSVHPGYVNTDMTSHKGEWTIEQGADAPLYLALLPENEEKRIRGSYVWKDRQVLNWTSNETPGRY